MSILEKLQDNTKILARFARRDTEDGCSPDWGEPKTVTLYVKRLEKDSGRGRNFRKAGTIICLTVRDFCWAEYHERDYCDEDNSFLSEQYRMEILEVLE